ncbi:MAG: hypothetical protein AUK47_17730 [Deltaproteobacteria bacterium CG2_30_63_29]|nr:MAG: hypothetical protein AUK47_17730 [Deltaproteobacteria bacterium CG2_30_63_29]
MKDVCLDILDDIVNDGLCRSRVESNEQPSRLVFLRDENGEGHLTAVSNAIDRNYFQLVVYKVFEATTVERRVTTESGAIKDKVDRYSVQ